MPPAHSSHRSGDTPASPDAGPERAGRFTRTQRLLLGLAAGLGVATLAGISFVLSYDDLRVLALEGRAAKRWAPAYPVMVDALVVVTILSLVVARHARWWSRWPRWILLFLLLAGSAAASVQRALKGFGPLPDEPLKAGVAVAPYVLLALATLLWLAMFRQMQTAHTARPSRRQRRAAAREGNASRQEDRQEEWRPEQQPIAATGVAPTLELPPVGGHARGLSSGETAAPSPSPELPPLGAAVAALGAASPAERTAERGNVPATADQPWEPEHDLVPGLRPVRSREGQSSEGQASEDQASEDQASEDQASEDQASEDRVRERVEGSDTTRTEGLGTAQPPPALDELPPFPAARHVEQPWEAAPPPPAVGSAARSGPDRTDAWLDMDEPDSSEPHEPTEQPQGGAKPGPSAPGRSSEPAVPAAETVPDLDVRNEVAAAAGATIGREASDGSAGAGHDTVLGEPESASEPSVPSQREAPSEREVPRAPTSLPTDVRLVGRSTPEPDFAATTQPDMVIPPSFAQDEEEDGDSAGPAGDRAEDPDAGTAASPPGGALGAPAEEPPGSQSAGGEQADREQAGDEQAASAGAGTGGVGGTGPVSSRPGGAEPMDKAAERTDGEADSGDEGDGEQWNAFGAEDAHLFTEEPGRATGRDDELFDDNAGDLDWTPPSSKFRSSPTPPRER